MRIHAGRLLQLLLVVFLVGHFALNLEISGDLDPYTPGHQGDLEDDRLNYIVIPMIGVLFTVAASVFLIGWRGALVFLAVTAVLSWLAEEIGTTTGLLFGYYEYGDLLGPKLGHVPWVIPAYWIMLLAVSYFTTSLICRNKLMDESDSDLLHIFWSSLVAGLIAVAYDLALDPYISQPSISGWTWYQDASKTARFQGGFYDVPIYNFFCWVLVGTLILVVVKLLFKRMDHSAVGTPDRYFALLPILFYVGFWFSHLSSAYEPPLQIISFVAMGIPAAAAVTVWRQSKSLP